MEIKWISLNVWKGENLQKHAIDFVIKENPDIVFLQEVYNSKDMKLEMRYRSYELFKETHLPYHVFAPVFRDITSELMVDANQGMAIFSKYPLMPLPSIYFFGEYEILYDYEKKPAGYSDLPRSLQHATCNIGSKSIELFNIHGIWGLDGKDNEKRVRMSNIVVRAVKNKKNVLLAGDFNTLPETKSIHAIETHLTNVFRDQLETTFNMKRKTNYHLEHAVVDMMFVSRDIAILDHYCPHVDISDHLPLVCKLEI